MLLPFYNDNTTRTLRRIELRQWQLDTLRLFDKPEDNKRLFITAPRQSGKSLMLATIIGRHFSDYDNIICVGHTRMSAPVLMNSIIQMFSHDGTYTVDKVDKDSFIIEGKVNIKFENPNFNTLGRLRGSKTLLALDEFSFNNNMDVIRTEIDKLPDLDVVGVSTPMRDSMLSTLRCGDFIKFPYTHFRVGMGEIYSKSEIENMMALYPEEFYLYI